VKEGEDMWESDSNTLTWNHSFWYNQMSLNERKMIGLILLIMGWLEECILLQCFLWCMFFSPRGCNFIFLASFCYYMLKKYIFEGFSIPALFPFAFILVYFFVQELLVCDFASTCYWGVAIAFEDLMIPSLKTWYI
jgi:hypothetical protein